MRWQIQEGTAPNNHSGLHAFPVSVPATASVQCLGSSREQGHGPRSCLAAQACFSLFFREQPSGCSWRQHRFLAERVYIGSLPESVQTLYVRRSPGVCFHSWGRGAWEVKVGGFGETLASVTRDQYWAVAPMGSRPPEQMPACNQAATQQKLTAM